jgi:hypothetical protein
VNLRELSDSGAMVEILNGFLDQILPTDYVDGFQPPLSPHACAA